MINIVLFGPPGCGKGTQAKMIVRKFGFIHLSTGMIFRSHMKKNTKLGNLVNYYIKSGKLVPDTITTNILNNELKKNLKKNGIIYDGYPRTIQQVFSLEKNLKILSLGRINIIFSFLIKKKIIIDRLINRGKVSNRIDDTNILIVKKRINEYEKETSLIWKNKKWKKFLVKIDATISINRISILIEKNINNLLKTS
ncbi:nucleoside monophosphate kinase [Blattabacterium cuenoti]|uniref:nucleoside monophosphate kinase n=1 Tax=Blattabacterium cuenoti TaxID=1653831 RepID=UPI00163C2ADC|nr:nucleoside monophosphate kinase [Blattabacterium cuenoti]